MTGERRVHRRPYFFEVFTLANLALIVALTWRHDIKVLRSLPATLSYVMLPLVGLCIAGVATRALLAAVRGQLRAFLRRITTAGWLSDSVRIIVFGTMMTDTYGWIKLTVPVLHPRLMDRQLWELDRMLFFGLSPNIFFLNLFSDERVLRFFDWSYARIFGASFFLSFAFFQSDPSRRIRTAFAGSVALLWIAGAWLYALVPSLGPAYYFSDVWFAYNKGLGFTQYIQSMLLHNYQNVLRLRAGQDTGPVNLMFGIAAFPSLHVGFQMFAFLWFRRLWLSGQVIYAVFVLIIFLGSMITGWHYMIDGVAGALLAWIAYWTFARAYRIHEWARLRSVKN